MMETAQARARNQRRLVQRLALDRAVIRRVLLQGVVNAVVVVVVHVIADQPAEMLFVQRDDVVEDLATATSHPSFSDSIGVSIQLHPIGALRTNASA